MKALKIIAIIIAIPAMIYFFGPKPVAEPVEDPVITGWNISLDSLDQYVKQKDLGIPDLKPNNESRIAWVDSIRKTRYALVYLHGFSASPLESGSAPFDLAKRFGMNLYLPLLPGHGRANINSFKELKPNELITAAKEAVAIGQLLGEDVIVMSCSTGSTLSIYLAGANPEMIDALIMYSPNLHLYDPMAGLITGPWGEALVKSIAGEYYNLEHVPDSITDPYWTPTYSSNGLIALQQLLDETMTPEVFSKIKQPYFIGYYFKNEEEQDHTISVPAILDFDKQTSTPADEKELVAFPEAGAHVIGNPLKSNQAAEVVEKTILYAEETLHLTD